MYVHRLAFDPAYSRSSPRLVNTLDTIEAASDEGLKRVEFLGGGERYKVELADRFEPLGRARAGLGATCARVRQRRARRDSAARQRLKRSERLHRLYLDGLAPVRGSSRCDGMRA